MSWWPSPTGSGAVDTAGRGSAPRAADAQGSSDIPRRVHSTSSTTHTAGRPAVAGRAALRGSGALFTRHDLLIVHPVPAHADVPAGSPITALPGDTRYADPCRAAVFAGTPADAP
ncbi:hypothetical protein ACWFRQ_03955 [Streptomyces niveus]